MALVLMEGFDLLTAGYVATKYPLGAQFGADMVAGRYTPGQGYRPGPGNQNGNFALQFPSAANMALGVGMKLPIGGMGTGIRLVEFRTSADLAQFCVGADANGAIRVARTNATLSSAPLATSANGIIASNAWFYMEVELVIHDSTGICRVWVNGAKVIDLSAADTKGQTAATAERILFSMGGSGEGGLTLDDIYLTDTSARLGESRVYVLEPVSDDTAQWTPSTGASNFAVLDEAPFNTTDYVSSATIGHADRYNFADLPYIPATIHAVQTSFFAAKDDAATRTVRANLINGVVLNSGGDFGLSATYLQRTDLFPSNTDGGGAWTYALVNALKSGPEVRA